MNHVPFPRTGAAASRRLGAARRAWPIRHFRRYLRHTLRVGSAVALGASAAAVILVAVPHAAYAVPDPGSPETFTAVVDNIRGWLVGILVAVATLFLTVGGLRYLAANGDPGELEKAKLALRSAVIGYALALLAPLFVTIVGTWVA
jgi:Type IV secretion system pilin